LKEKVITNGLSTTVHQKNDSRSYIILSSGPTYTLLYHFCRWDSYKRAFQFWSFNPSQSTFPLVYRYKSNHCRWVTPVTVTLHVTRQVAFLQK